MSWARSFRDGGAATLLEWDANIPEFPVVHAEVLKAKHHIQDKPADVLPGGDLQTESVEERRLAVPHPASFIVAEAE